MLVLNYISMQRDINGGRLLNRNEILNAIDYVVTNQDDMVVLMPKIKSAIDKAKVEEGTNFTAENAKKIVEEVETNLKDAVNRVYSGKADVENFVYLGEARVNAKNLDTVNNDITLFKEIVRVSDYRISGLSDQVTKALAVYSINKDNVSKDDNNNTKEYAAIGRNIEYSYDDTSALRLIQSYILIKQKLNYNEYLNRQEILDTIDEVSGNVEQYKRMIPEIAT